MKNLDQAIKILEKSNAVLDEMLIRYNLKKPKTDVSAFEKNLSIFIQEFLINYSSGITLERALKLTVESQCQDEELKKLIKVYPSVIESINLFAVRKDRKEIWRFVRLINQTEMTGSLTTVDALEKLHDELWQQKLVKAKKKSEQISIQLTFLLMLSLISVIITVITPIIMMFN